jgi:electron transport protein HydN
MALKCDRCAYMENPVCVEVCPTHALELVELDDLEDTLRERRQEVTDSLSARKEQGGLLLLDLGR